MLHRSFERSRGLLSGESAGQQFLEAMVDVREPHDDADWAMLRSQFLIAPTSSSSPEENRRSRRFARSSSSIPSLDTFENYACVLASLHSPSPSASSSSPPFSSTSSGLLTSTSTIEGEEEENEELLWRHPACSRAWASSSSSSSSLSWWQLSEVNRSLLSRATLTLSRSTGETRAQCRRRRRIRREARRHKADLLSPKEQMSQQWLHPSISLPLPLALFHLFFMLALLLLLLLPTAAAAATCEDDSEGLQGYMEDFSPAVDPVTCAKAASEGLCSSTSYGPLVRVYCPVSCDSCYVTSTSSEASDLECADQDEQLRNAYADCSAAESDCDHPIFGEFVRGVCPVTCGTCSILSVNWTVSLVDYLSLQASSSTSALVAAQSASILADNLPDGIESQHVIMSGMSSGDGGGVNFFADVGLPRAITTLEATTGFVAETFEASLAAGLKSISSLSSVLEAGAALAQLEVSVTGGPVTQGSWFESAYTDTSGSQTNCSDDDEGLAEYGDMAGLEFRACLDVVAAANASTEISSYKLNSTRGFCVNMFYGARVQRHCPNSCRRCTDTSEDDDETTSLDVEESVPHYDLELTDFMVEFYGKLAYLDTTKLEDSTYSESVEAIQSEILQAIVFEADKIVADQVSVELFFPVDSSDPRFQAVVTSTDEDEARYVFAQLNNSLSSLESSMTSRFRSSSAVVAAARSNYGSSVAVTGLSAPFVTPPFLSSLATCTGSSWASTNIEVVEYYTVQLPGPLFGFAACQEQCAAEEVGGRFVGCIADEATYNLIKEDVLLGETSVWIGLLQPAPTTAEEPAQGWTWMDGCDGYMSFWHPGHGTAIPKQPDDGELWETETGELRRENCAVLLNGYANASAQAFDVPCLISGRDEDVQDWIPNTCLCQTASESAAKVPMCSICRPPVFLPGTSCMYETFGCTGLAPGESCGISCKSPYGSSQSVTAECPSGNSNPFKMPVFSQILTCTCPEPDPAQGYTKTSSGSWVCASGYTGTATVSCPCGEEPTLSGCTKLQSCAVPTVDRCRLDISDCQNKDKRYAGSACTVTCRSDESVWATARCPDDNTDATTELEFSSLKCTISSCTDPVSPAGYTWTGSSWECADGYIGSVTRSCYPNETEWAYPTCTAVATLSGCELITNCGPPTLTDAEACAIDISACDSVAPGQSCEMSCVYPWEGTSTQAYCPTGNADANGLVLNKTLPTCTVIQDECDAVEVEVLPAAYTKLLSGWACATSYTGDAEKSCVANTDSCELEPVLSGCSQVVPCEYSTDDCRYDIYNCLKVQPGDSCEIGCKAPYSGTPTTAVCSSTNNDPDGLNLIEGLPTCGVVGCSDPDPVPDGYVQTVSGWGCAENYTDAGLGVVKTCVVAESGSCTSVATLSGCIKVEPCAALSNEGSCWLDVSACTEVLAGGSCAIPCRDGWLGTAGSASCPSGNTDTSTELTTSLPTCYCEDPDPVPAGYEWDKDAREWVCEEGYAGSAVKSCVAGTNCTTSPVLSGCNVPVPCEVATWDDAGSTKNSLKGTLRFGPAKVGDKINEDEVLSYKVYFADADCVVFGDPIATVSKSSSSMSCCKTDLYNVPLSVSVVLGATRLLIVALTSRGIAPDGGILDMEDIFGAFQDQVRFTFTISNLNYAAVTAKALLTYNLEVAIKKAVAEEAANDVSPSHIDLELTAGSIVVNVIIKPPYPIVAEDVQYKLASNPSALSVALRTAVRSVEGLLTMDGVDPDLVTIASLSRPVLVQDSGDSVGTSAARRLGVDVAGGGGGVLGLLLLQSLLLMTCWQPPISS